MNGNKTAVWLTDEEAELFKWMCSSYDIFLSLKQAGVKNGSATINFNPGGEPITVVTNVTIYRKKLTTKG